MSNQLDPDTATDRTGAALDRAVVVGVDGSRSSERALHYAVGLAARQGTSLVVVHIRPVVVAHGWTGVDAVLDGGSLSADLRAEIEGLARECGVRTAIIDTPSHERPPAVLARIAHSHRADAVVVGASCNPIHRLMGSTGAYLIKHCTCPVTVVP